QGYKLIRTDGAEYPIGPEGLTIGRSATNDVVVSERQVSRKHARLLLAAGRCWIRDEGSDAGTFINAAPVRGQQEIRPNDTLTVGSQSFRLVATSAAAAPAPAAAKPKAKAEAYQLVAQDGTVYPISAAGLSLGRSRTNNVVIPDSQVSRKHARLLLAAGRCWIRDQGSDAGTYLNNTPVRGQQEIRPNDTLVIGTSSFTLKAAAAPAAVPAADRKRRQPLLFVGIAGVVVVLVVLGIAIGGGSGGTGVPQSPPSPPGTQPAISGLPTTPPTVGETDQVNAIPHMDPDADPPPLTPLDIAGPDSPFDHPILGDQSFDPNEEGPLVMVEDGLVYLNWGDTWIAFEDENGTVSDLPLQPLAHVGHLNSAMPHFIPNRFGLFSGLRRIASFAGQAGRMIMRGAEHVYEQASDAFDWTTQQISTAAGIVQQGGQLVLDATIDIGTWTAQQAYNGVQWVRDGAEYVALQTVRGGSWAWSQTQRGARWVWEQLNQAYYWVTLGTFEHVCGNGGEPGPGPGSDGSLPLRLHPEPGFDAHYSQEQMARLELARTWMPYIELSYGELCGEILRVVAVVVPYNGEQKASTLAEADRVEITYTLFYKEDGGRYAYIGAHVGDNEGFVLGLVRSSRTDGRCGLTDPHFEFSAGRNIRHKNIIPDWLSPIDSFLGHSLSHAAEFLGLERGIEDWDYGDLGTACPSVNDTSFRLLSAENKHAHYYDRIDCEITMLGWRFDVLDFAGYDVDLTLGGVEECDAGRPLYDLSPYVELLNDGMRSQPNAQERQQVPWNSHWPSYWHQTRGNPNICPDLQFHVPSMLWPGANMARVMDIHMQDVPHDSEWVITVLGYQGFDPLVRVDGSPSICYDDSLQASMASIHGLPVFGSVEGSERAAQISFTAVDGGDRTVSIDSFDGNPGRFAVIIASTNGSNAIYPETDEDVFLIEGISNTDLGFYLLADDPVDLHLYYPDNDLLSDDEPEMEAVMVSTSAGEYSGNPTDPYLPLVLGASDEHIFAINSVDGTGNYVTIIAAEFTGAGEGEPELGTGDVQVTLRWDTRADLDLYVRDPDGETIYYGWPQSMSGGMLDVDANASCGEAAAHPVENIFWPTGGAPVGTYQVSVVDFSDCGEANPTAYEVTIKVDGQVIGTYTGTIFGWHEEQVVTQFDR
ncbi:MAG: FHA domain-containing protein, partial [Anaerolineales bacterium]